MKTEPENNPVRDLNNARNLPGYIPVHDRGFPDSATSECQRLTDEVSRLGRENKLAYERGYLACASQLWETVTGEWETKEAFIERVKHILSNVPSDLSLLASGIRACSAGEMPEVPQAQGLGRLAR